jgi:hypothetical protein
VIADRARDRRQRTANAGEINGARDRAREVATRAWKDVRLRGRKTTAIE